MELATIKQRLNGAFAWLTMLSAAAGVAFLWLLSSTNSGFEKVNEKISTVGKVVASQSAQLDGVKESLQRIEGKLDRDSSKR